MSRSRTFSYSSKSEGHHYTLFGSPRNQDGLPTATLAPMMTYIGGTLALDIQAFGSVIPTIGGHDPLAIGWNGIDAACNLKTAWDMYSDEDYYHPQKSLMIGLNIASGLNLLSFTDSFHSGAFFNVAKMGMGSSMASPAFAFSMFCDLTAAAIDFYYSTEEGYMEAMVGKVEFLENRISKMSAETSQTVAWTSKLGNLVKQRNDLLDSLSCQFIFYEDKENCSHNLKKEFIQKQKDRLTQITSNSSRPVCDNGSSSSEAIAAEHLKIEKTRKALHTANTCKLVTKAASFTGMLFQALPHILLLAGVTSCVPGLNLLSLAIITLVSVAYAIQLYRHYRANNDSSEEVSVNLEEGFCAVTCEKAGKLRSNKPPSPR